MANNPYKYDDPSGHKLKDFLQVGKNFVKPSIPQYALDLANTARNTILDKRIQEVKNTKVTNQQEVAEKAAKLLNLSLKRSITVFKPKPCPRKLKWWEKDEEWLKSHAKWFDDVKMLRTQIEKEGGI